MNPNANSFVFALPNGEQVRVQQHKVDATKVAIKAANDSVLDNFAMLGGVDLKADKVQGHTYAMLLADKAQVAEACKNIVLGYQSEATAAKFIPDGDTLGSDDSDEDDDA